MAEVTLSTRGVSTCRACGFQHLESVLDLGEQPLANELLPSPDAADALFPLHLRVCRTCGLGQVGEFVLPERLFGDYPYLSSVSQSWLAHARNYAVAMREELNLRNADLVIEVASNDGYLLREFHELGVPVLGVEPAGNVATLARAAGIPTLSIFFGQRTADEIVNDHGQPRLVVANNVMAHVPDLADFVAGLASLCAENTIITVENPSFVTLLQETQFDTIYHEHFSYLSAHSVSRLVARHGLELVRVESLATHGGSNRYWIRRAGQQTQDPSVEASIERELSAGLLSQDLWSAFSARARATIDGVRHWLNDCAERDARVTAYGAAAKGNTLLNASKATAADILLVADGSFEKQGKYLPGSRIPIVTADSLARAKPTDVLILPWNLADEIRELLAKLVPDAQVWTAVPQLTRMGS